MLAWSSWSCLRLLLGLVERAWRLASRSQRLRILWRSGRTRRLRFGIQDGPGLQPSMTGCVAKPVTRVSTLKSVNRRGRDEGAGSMRSRVGEDKNHRAAGSALSRSNEGFGIFSEALVFVRVRLQPLDDRPDPLPE